MTPSEDFVLRICKHSFLPFWSFLSPIGKNRKELCDVLIVCGENVVIISVKDISVSHHHDQQVQFERWARNAIDDSVKQIYGAERFLNSMNEISTKDGIRIKLPHKPKRNTFRIAIAFGSKPNFPLPHGNFGKGYVHVYDEKSTSIVLNELDTITDFTDYLIAKENLFKKCNVLIPSESDFLAIYLQTGLKFQGNFNTITCGDDEWGNYIKSDDYADWRRDILPSYIWDELVNTMHKHHARPGTSKERILQLEEAIRYINLESRMNRIELGKVLFDAIKKKVSRRMIRPLPGRKHTYVFIPLSRKNWDGKESELKICCTIARAENPEAETIIGIAIGRSPTQKLYFDYCYLHLPEINNEFIKRAKVVKQELGYFKEPVVTNSKDF